MSGITGIFRRDGKDVDPADIKKMNDKISHRGPDGSRVWCEGPVAFGHQMLHTTQESLHEILPFEDEESGLVITADARIDNRKDLAPLLGIEDTEYVSDSYFILKAYEKWGEKCPEELLGDFAFAIWDNNKETLFCVRDHMGVKPFYYYLSEDIFFFSTEMKAFFCISDVPYKINELKVAEYLITLKDKESTFYENILTLIAGHSFCLYNDKSRMIKYWELDYNSKITMNSEEEYVTAFKEIFAEAVKCRLRSYSSLGFELSGGLDSSSIVCMVKQIVNENKEYKLSNFNTFSLVYAGFPEGDEREYIQKVVNYSDMASHFIFCENISPLEDIDAILLYEEQPFFTPFMSNYWKAYKKMKDNNVRVLLVGSGADELLFMSNSYLLELAIHFKFKKLFKEINCISKLSDKNFSKLFFTNVGLPLIPEYIKKYLRRFLISKPIFNPLNILNQRFVDKLGGCEFIKSLYSKKRLRSFQTKKIKEYQYFNIDSLTEDKYTAIKNKATSPFYVEPRYPFLDKRLIEFCYALPNEMKINNGWNKYILRCAMEGIIPPEIQKRTTKGATEQVYYKNFILHEKKFIETMIRDESTLISNYVNMDVLKQLYADYNSGFVSLNTTYLWFVAILFLWLQKSKITEK